MTTPTPAQLHHLADRARRGVLLPTEGAILADAITVLLARLDEQNGAANVAVSAVRIMNRAGAERDRYRAAWQSARHRAALYLKSNRNLVASLDNGHAAQLHAQRVAQSAARDAATALTAQLAAEAAIERVRAECTAITADVHGQHDEDDDGMRDAVHRIRTTLDQAQQPTTEATC